MPGATLILCPKESSIRSSIEKYEREREFEYVVNTDVI